MGIETKIGIAVLVVGLVFAIALPVAVTAVGNSAFQDLSTRSREVNRAVARGVPWLSMYVNGYIEGITALFNMTATAVFPGAIVEGAQRFPNLTVSFVIILPANASYFYGQRVDAYFLSTRSSIPFDDRILGVGGYEPSDVGVYVLGLNGTGSWNVTVHMYPESYPTLNIPQNQSDWLSFTSQAETYLSVGLHGWGDMIGVNGTVYTYSLSTWFDFQQSPTTFYRFSYPVAAWLGYGGSMLIAVASLCLLLHRARDRHTNEESGTQVGHAGTF